MLRENEIAKVLVDCAIEVHRTLGPGLLERVYEEALAWELQQRGLKVERQVLVPIRYKEVEIGEPFRLDLLIEGAIIVECKATSQWNPVFESQVLTYLKLSECKLGFVLNFGERYMKDGISRVVNGLED